MGNGIIEQVRALIRDVPDFPQPGIVFKDITPLLADGTAFSSVTGIVVTDYKGYIWPRTAADLVP